MIPSAKESMTDPDGFFSDRISELQLRFSLIIVVAYIISRALAFFPALLPVEGELHILVLYGLTGFLLGSSMVGFVGWIFYSVILYLLSALFRGSGSFRQTMAMTAWGFIPMILGQLLSCVATIISVLDEPSVSVASGNELSAVISQTRSGPLFVIVSLAMMAFNIWSAYIWIYGLQHARDLSKRQAFIVVGLPISFGIIVKLLFSLS